MNEVEQHVAGCPRQGNDKAHDTRVLYDSPAGGEAGPAGLLDLTPIQPRACRPGLSARLSAWLIG